MLRNNTDSIFYFIKRLITYKKKYKCLGLGDYRFFESNLDSVMIFNRFIHNEEIIMFFNFSDSPTKVLFQHENYRLKKLNDLFTQQELTFDSSDFVELELGYYNFKWFLVT